jgi:hypothetical protein
MLILNTYRLMKNISYKTIISISLFIIFFSQQLSISDAIDVYKPGLKLSLSAKWWGVYAHGTIEVIRYDKTKGQDVVLVRSQTEEVSGLLGFLIKFLRVYKGSNTFDSYIDPKTGLPVRYEVYKLEKDGTKKHNEHVYFDRKTKRVASYDDNSTILSNVQPDIQDTFSGFLNIIRMLNNEDIYVGKNFSLNLYIYREYSKLNVRVISQKVVNGYNVYTLKIDRLPDVFKYPASLTFDVAEKEGLKFPTKGICTIGIPIKDINVDGDLTIINGD